MRVTSWETGAAMMRRVGFYYLISSALVPLAVISARLSLELNSWAARRGFLFRHRACCIVIRCLPGGHRRSLQRSLLELQLFERPTWSFGAENLDWRRYLVFNWMPYCYYWTYSSLWWWKAMRFVAYLIVSWWERRLAIVLPLNWMPLKLMMVKSGCF